MAKGYTVGIASETKAFKQGVETGIIKPIENAVEALDKMGKTRGPDQVEASLKDAQKATERLKDETKETADAIDREFKDSYRRARQSSSDATSRMSDDVENFKGEAIQNLSETASSFDGSLDSMADGVQGLTGGLASALTPGIGIPVAIIGAIAAAFALSWSESAEESEERIRGMYQDMLESGQSFVSENYIQDAIAAIGEDTAQWADAIARAESSGLSVQTVLRAMVGDQDAINTVRQAETDKLNEQIGLINSSAESEQSKADKIDAANVKYAAAVEWLGKISGETDTAANKAAIVAGAFSTGNAVLDAQLRKIQDIAAGMDGLAKEKTIKITADTTGLEGALRRFEGQTLRVNVNGQITRIGNQVW